jgi:hypothetical protein
MPRHSLLRQQLPAQTCPAEYIVSAANNTLLLDEINANTDHVSRLSFSPVIQNVIFSGSNPLLGYFIHKLLCSV